MKHIVGNLFDHIQLVPIHAEGGPEIVIPHVCNDIGGWGSGFVVPLGEMFPRAREGYLKWHKVGHTGEPNGWPGNPFALGYTQLMTIEPRIWVGNMIAQSGLISEENTKPLKYYALVKCMEAVRDLSVRRMQIHAPKFGSDRAGGDWNIIEELIHDIWEQAGIDVTIYSLE